MQTRRSSHTVGGGGEWQNRVAERGAGNRGLLAAKLDLFQPLNGFALVGDNLRLPDERNGHEAHGDDAEDEDETDVGLLSGEPKCMPKPSHGRGSPSTPDHPRNKANPVRQARGHISPPPESKAIRRPHTTGADEIAIAWKIGDLQI